MAVTNQKEERTLNKATTPQQDSASSGISTAATVNSQNNGYTPGQSVQQAQQQMQQVQQQKPGAYQQSDSVTQAQQALQNIQNNKPQSYQSKYGSALDGILQQIQNPQQFKYEFNGDELFKYYADLYTQKGKQASADAMGQAAALTGGYGNSYGQQVANQAYDQYLLSLYDKGMELRDKAYQQYQDQRGDLYNQYNVLQGADATDYDRYRDTVGDWEKNRDYYTDYANNERNFDYGQYRDTVGDWENERDYYTNRYDTERNFDYGQYTDQRNFDEQVRQFNENLNWERMSSEQKYAAEYAMQILAMGQMPSEDLLMAAGLSAEDAQKMMAQLTTGGSGGRSGSKPKTYIVDQNGNYFTVDENGKYTYVNPKNVKKTDYVDDGQMYDPKANAGMYTAYTLTNDKPAAATTLDVKKKKNINTNILNLSNIFNN